MNDYRNYLEHHGILGQKWGIRRFQNTDGSLTAEGKKRYLSNKQIDSVHETFSKSNYNDDISNTVFNITKADKNALKQAKEELKTATEKEKQITKIESELFKEIENDDTKSTYYEAISEIAESAWKKPVSDMTMEEIAGAAYHGLYDDGQQGMINAYSVYTYKNGLENKVVDTAKKSAETIKKYRDSASKIIQDALDEVGGETLSASKNNPNYLASKGLVNRIFNSMDTWDTSKGRWYLTQAGHAADFTKDDKTKITQAENIASKIKNSSDKNTWYLLNDAVDNLGLSDTKASDLTQSDWNRINREISKLRDDGEGDWD